MSQGLRHKEDLDHIKERGCIPGADPGRVSTPRLERGRAQLGTLGSGNHFAEVGYVSGCITKGLPAYWGERMPFTIVVHRGRGAGISGLR